MFLEFGETEYGIRTQDPTGFCDPLGPSVREPRGQLLESVEFPI